MEIILGIGFALLGILIIRILGAWMHRINEIINLQKEMLEEIRRLRD